MKIQWIKRGEASEEKNTCASYHFFTGHMPCWFHCIQNRHPREERETHNSTIKRNNLWETYKK